MTEFSESVYFQASDRSAGIQWLKDNDLAGYVLKPRGDWVQVFPDWEHVPDDKTIELLSNSEGLVVYYYFAEEQFWSFSLYRDGELDFRYECIWLVDEYALDGKSIDEAASLLEVPADELDEVIHRDGSASWDDLAENAAGLANLLELPNHAFASFSYADEDAAETGLDEMFVGPTTGYDLDLEDDEPGAEEPMGPGDIDVPEDFELPESEAPPEPEKPGGDAPWQHVYALASNFLQHLEDDDLVEYTLDSQLARDRLVERLTQLIIDNPVRDDNQVLEFWFDELMDCPEVVDIFATDQMLQDVYDKARQDVEDQE